MSAFFTQIGSRLLQYSQQCGLNSTHTKVGLGMTVGALIASYGTSNEQKRQAIDSTVKVYRKCGVKDTYISDSELRQGLWQTMTSVNHVLKASPLFYGVYHAIHPSKLRWGPHLLQSCGRGAAGSLASVPAIAVFYSVAAIALPVIQSRLQDRGYEKQDAVDTSQATVFVGVGAPLEFAVEALGCGIPPSQLTLSPSLMGTAFIAGRLGAGVLLQYRAVGESQEENYKADRLKELKSFAISWFGTTIAQHGINATMQTMAHGHGVKGVWRYLVSGSTTGVGSLQSAALRFGGTGVQRLLFLGYWNHLNHAEREVPSYIKDD